MVIKINAYLSEFSRKTKEKAIKKFLPKKHYTNSLVKEIEKLSGQEMNYLNIYISHKKEVLYVDLCDSTMARLYTKQITERTIEKRKWFEKGYGYNLNPWAREYLEKNKSLFSKCTTTKIGMKRET